MPRRSGQVYMLKNLANGKVYVGCTDAPLVYRIKQHMTELRGGYHKNEALQADYNKGHEFTSFAIGEKRTRCVEEEFWMKILRTYDERFGYNTNEWSMNPVRRAVGLSYKISPKKGKRYKVTIDELIKEEQS